MLRQLMPPLPGKSCAWYKSTSNCRFCGFWVWRSRSTGGTSDFAPSISDFGSQIQSGVDGSASSAAAAPFAAAAAQPSISCAGTNQYCGRPTVLVRLTSPPAIRAAMAFVALCRLIRVYLSIAFALQVVDRKSRDVPLARMRYATIALIPSAHACVHARRSTAKKLPRAFFGFAGVLAGL